jgi:hypothetical protein
MKKGTLFIVFTVTLVAAGMTARAHHSFAATYEESKTVKIEGKLVQFMFRNPHSFVHIMPGRNSGGRWSGEAPVSWAGKVSPARHSSQGTSSSSPATRDGIPRTIEFAW